VLFFFLSKLSPPAGSFDNYGSILVNLGGSGYPGTFYIGAPFNNFATVNISDGVVSMSVGGSHSGTFIPGNGTLQITGGAQTFTSTSIVRNGLITFSGGTSVIGGSLFEPTTFQAQGAAIVQFNIVYSTTAPLSIGGSTSLRFNAAGTNRLSTLTMTGTADVQVMLSISTLK
jgi:hypothetical protein